MISFQITVNNKLDQFIADPALSQIEMMRKRVAFNWTIGSVISVTVLTVLAYFINADIIGHFGMVLLLFYSIELPLFKLHNFDFYQSIFLGVVILTAFVFMLIFGGYTYSAGLVFVGLTCVMSSILMKSVKVAFLLFSLYVVTILALAVLNPYLTPHPDITPQINFTFFIINTIWMSAAMMFFIISYLTERNKYQIAETFRLQELDEAKNQLFTNITHEFRTPITLISGLVGEIKSKDGETVKSLDQIKNQSRKLLNLVNQILNLAKIDSNTMHTHYIQADVLEFLRYLVESFHSKAESKGLTFAIDFHLEELLMDFDQDKLEAIVTNLVGNAIKFTPKGGEVSIAASMENEDHLLIQVRDTGIGINETEKEKIFQRFYQGKEDSYQEGNGIGLTIVKEFVSLMNGTLQLCSTSGVGSTFTVCLPVKNDAPIQSIEPEKNIDKLLYNEDAGQDEFADELPLLLIIDDHPDIVNYLKKIVKGQYRIIEANDGIAGFNKAVEFIPDIILSDVMMPKMDGFEFLKKVKSEFRTSHIPVLMLTAKADRQAKLEGLQLGAEAYLLKPFDKEELLVRLRKLLDLRETLRAKYQQVNLEATKLQESGNPEDQFIYKVGQVIDKHLDDDSFNIAKLCRELGMSHTQLYRKFSALTNITVNKYIRQYRLHVAINLLKNSDLNISQIALEVGLPNLAYFSRIFTEEFNINPSKVRQSESFVGRNGK